MSKDCKKGLHDYQAFSQWYEERRAGKNKPSNICADCGHDRKASCHRSTY